MVTELAPLPVTGGADWTTIPCSWFLATLTGLAAELIWTVTPVDWLIRMPAPVLSCTLAPVIVVTAPVS